MGFLTKIFSKGAKDLTKSVGSIIDNLSTSDQEKLKAKAELTEIVFSALNNLQNAQRDIILAEAKGNWLQRSWRPLVMLTFTVMIVVGGFTTIPYLADSSPFWVLLKIGLGGYVIGRSAEKIADSVTRNTDLTFLRKKDRKDRYE